MRATAPPRLLELIRSGLEYSAELQAVRTQLRGDFDVRATRPNPTTNPNPNP